MGNPHLDFDVVHIAGSKGKGSTCAYTAAILKEAGVRTGRFLSPHVSSYRERLVIDGELISEGQFGSLIDATRHHVASLEAAHPTLGRVTAFELITAAALWWFAQCHCSAAVIEVGLGGTLDATNVVAPAVSVITQLDLEHTAILGNTIGEIASNKAGIIKPGVPVISASQEPAAMEVIEARARLMRAPLSVLGREITISAAGPNVSVAFRGTLYRNLTTGMPGRHQAENAALAVAAVVTLARQRGLSVTRDEIGTGLRRASLPGRFQTVEIDPSTTVVIDGAHTARSMTAMVDTVRSTFLGWAVTAVVGMLTDKDPATVLGPLSGLAERCFTVSLPSPRARTASEIAHVLRDLGCTTVAAESLDSACAMALAANSESDRRVVVFTGSMTIIAAALSQPAIAAHVEPCP
jgi:dihydrofolate synthase/folylpolyglutamate synthase